AERAGTLGRPLVVREPFPPAGATCSWGAPTARGALRGASPRAGLAAVGLAGRCPLGGRVFVGRPHGARSVAWGVPTRGVGRGGLGRPVPARGPRVRGAPPRPTECCVGRPHELGDL